MVPMTNPMKISILLCAVITTISVSLRAGTPEQEKAFTDKYKTAFEAKNTATLELFLTPQGADPAIVGFYKMSNRATLAERFPKSNSSI
jgi:hypothetical protein